MAKYDLEKVKELWEQEPDDNRVFRAATEDIEEYPPEVQAIIKEEAKRRRKAELEGEATPKQSLLHRFWSSIGIYYDPKESWLKKTGTVLVYLIAGFIGYLFAKEVVRSFFRGSYFLFGIGAAVLISLFWLGYSHRPKKPKDEQKE